MQVEFVSQGAQDDQNRGANTSRLVNFYREAVNGSETQFSLRSVLGQEAFSDVGVSVGATPRAAVVDGDTLYVSSNGALFEVTTAGVATNKATISDSALTSMAANSGVIAMAVNGTYKTWDGTTLTTPATGNFASIGSVDYVKGYTIYTQKDGRKWGWSDLLDAETLPALNFATAEARDDNCLRILGLSGNAWIFKERSIEVWYPTGEAGANAFYPIGGGVTDIGLKAYSLVAKFPGGAFFVGSDNVAYVTVDSAINPVSAKHPGVTESIVNDDPQACFYYEDGAHKFCVVTFSDRPAWVLDITTGEWHERSEGVLGAWTASDAVYFNAGWKTIHTTGKIYSMVKNGADVESPLIRRAVSSTLYTGTPFRVSKLQVFGRVGWSDIGRDATCWLRVSRDRGHGYSTEIWRSLGDYGDFDREIVWRAMGRFTSLTVEIGISDPFDASFNATANLEVA